ncbi:uncharacterized protein LOC130744967 [Lotus japonicus]|uniref:uncharacterized protein LOC130744967 n=1 Tax=Lotus japonicus TaxID=34305 RepID=UPI002590D971|nr:uncharacterized protein LOC130744967 [Lotus japonicus]
MVHFVPFGGYMGTLCIIPRKNEEIAVIDQQFVLNWANVLGAKWLIEDPLQRLYIVDFNMDFTTPTLLQGWGAVVSFYGLDETHWCVLQMVAASHFHMRIFDLLDNEISYDPFRAPVEGSGSVRGEEDEVESVRIDRSEEDALSEALALVPYAPPPSSTDISVEAEQELEMVAHLGGTTVQANEGPPQYRMHLNTTLTPYRAYGSQYNLPRKVAEYVRQNGRQPWVIRGPTGIKKDINILFRPDKTYTKLGKGWRKFCKLHDIQHGQKMSMHFTDGVSRLNHEFSIPPVAELSEFGDRDSSPGHNQESFVMDSSSVHRDTPGEDKVQGSKSREMSCSPLLSNITNIMSVPNDGRSSGMRLDRAINIPGGFHSTSSSNLTHISILQDVHSNGSLKTAEDIIITQQSAAARLRRIQHVKIKRSCLVMDKQNFPQRDSNTGTRDSPRLKVKKRNIGKRPNIAQSRASSSKSSVVKTKPGEGVSLCRKLVSEFNAAANSPLNVPNIYDDAELIDEVDLGDASFLCRICHAQMWYEERIDKSKQSNNPEFYRCCMKGKVVLPFISKPPLLLYNLLHGIDSRSKHFKDNIRAYNSMFAFTSIGGKVESSLNNGGGPPQFVLSGQNYHRIGTLLPQAGQSPKFAQLYIYDTQNENSNRMKPFNSMNTAENLDISLVEDLKQMIDENNVLAKSFRKVRDYINEKESSSFALRLFRKRGKDPRTYNLPTSDEIAALIVGDFDTVEVGRDIIVKKDGVLSRIHETHTSFIPLQYPLIFPYGEDGWQEDIPLSGISATTSSRLKPRVTLREFITFRIQERNNEYGNVVLCRRLFQQFVVDCFTMIESQRLSFIRNNQKLIRADFLNGLEEAMSRGETDPSFLGTRIVLPASFIGGKRYMFDCCQDAMAICKRYGYPDLFITVTCNSAWKEIDRFVRPRNVRADERPDVCCRVFKIKLDHLIATLKSGIIFGPLDAGMYTIEFQKRGLPHAHILLWLSKENKLVTTSDIDKCISAEIPDPILYPKLNNVVSTYMLHGPCGSGHYKSPCMTDGKCSKFFPKKFQESTIIDDDGYPVYKRRDTGVYVDKKGIRMDNSFVVPYNPQLLMLYNGHINVEYCNKSNAIKYLFKYVSKGPDRVNVEISNQNKDCTETEVKDEIKQYYDCRYLTPCEAVWRTLKLFIHVKWPSVKKVTFHLPNKQSVCFKDHDDLKRVVDKATEKDTMFIAWMKANCKYGEGKAFTYAEFPSHFVYDEDTHSWHPRKKGTSIGRLQYIPHGVGELYYLRILLTLQKGCTSWESIRTVDDVEYPTFRDACYALGLLADDKEFLDAITEANELASGTQLRKFFVMLLTTNTMSKPEFVWEKSWRILSDSIVYERRKKLRNSDLHINDDDLKNLCLIELEKLLHMNGRSLKDYPCLPFPHLFDDSQFENKFVADELNYDKAEMEDLHKSLLNSLTAEQHKIYKSIMDAVMNRAGGLFFLYGFGGTGKTYLWNTLSAAVRAQGLIVLNVASSGIASLLLPGGRTAHSRFSIPISIKESSTCNVSQGSLKAELLQKTSLIIWDEAPMLNKWCFEALDRTLNDIMKSHQSVDSGMPFGGKVVVLGGDFRQILPVIQKGSRSEIVSATINSSYLWKQCHVLKLTKNMRLISSKCHDEKIEIKRFADWLLDIGDGKVNTIDAEDSTIQIPDDLLILDSDNPIQSLIDFAYPQMLQNLNEKNYKFFEDRAILAPTLESVEIINTEMLGKIPGEIKEYLSCDTTCRSDEDSEVEAEWFTTEFLNNIQCSGIPNHKLSLKVGVPIMLLRNIDQAGGLCNGTRMIVKDMGKNVIVANVVSGKQLGEKVLISRMDLVPTDSGLPFKFVRRQFPIALCFAMTINKSQGQTLSHVGLYLPKPVFTHGQLYVALSRVKSRKGLKILLLDEDGLISKVTKNVVYNEVFQNV